MKLTKNISVVEFARRDDMKYALKELNGTKLNGYRLKLEEAVSYAANKKKNRQ